MLGDGEPRANIGIPDRTQFRRVLIFGLGISALLLLTALFIAFRAMKEINAEISSFAAQQELAKRGIDEIVQKQGDLNSRWLQLARRKDLVRREEILSQLADSRNQMSVALESAYQRAELLRESIYKRGEGVLRWTLWLFVACVVLSIASGVWAAQASARLFEKLSTQTAELTRLQYQFLETQEQTARRFSHELHDELGQVLTAVKANLSAVRKNNDTSRLDDCMALTDRAIQDVRQMSHLLRPVMLDDFGLDTALRVLAESFSERTGIAVNYRGNADGVRFPDSTETNLYRIAQEALTNVARHSNATRVELELTAKDGRVVLNISDNGVGLSSQAPPGRRGLGLAGMETRARGCGGAFRIQSTPGAGLKIEVTCPTNL